jgi:hypothetical protein
LQQAQDKQKSFKAEDVGEEEVKALEEEDGHCNTKFDTKANINEAIT